MSQYIGKLGQLVEVECEGTEAASQEARYVEHFSLTGRRRVQAIPQQPRQWSLSHDALRGEDEAVLTAFVTGAWGLGPWHWVPVAAQNGNMLTPRQADLINYRTSGGYFTEGGPVRSSDGTWAARSLAVNLSSGWVGLLDPSEDSIPVIPGVPVTFSLDVDSGSSDAPATRLQFRDAQGTSMAQWGTTGRPGPGMQRVTRTATPPEGSTHLLIGVSAPTKRFTRPQLTWTDREVPFTGGKGCRNAVVDGASSDLRFLPSGGGILSSTGFTIMEVQ